MKLTPARQRVLQALSETDTYLHVFITGHVYRNGVRGEQVRADIVEYLRSNSLIEDTLGGARNEDLDWVYRISEKGRNELALNTRIAPNEAGQKKLIEWRKRQTDDGSQS